MTKIMREVLEKQVDYTEEFQMRNSLTSTEYLILDNQTVIMKALKLL